MNRKVELEPKRHKSLMKARKRLYLLVWASCLLVESSDCVDVEQRFFERCSKDNNDIDKNEYCALTPFRRY